MKAGSSWKLNHEFEFQSLVIASFVVCVPLVLARFSFGMIRRAQLFKSRYRGLLLLQSCLSTLAREPQELFDTLLQRYSKLTPQAEQIKSLLHDRGETSIVNDHIALRTLNDPRLGGINRLAQPFEQAGYQAQDEYAFPEKKLFARYYAHPGDSKLPKVFISELLLEGCSPSLQDTMKQLVDQIPEPLLEDPWNLLTESDRPWTSEYETYRELYQESEYAAWVSAFGFCANHFTIYFNDLKTFESLSELASFVQESGYPMNDSGGIIKGSPAVHLEQCSTQATRVPVKFNDGTHEVPSCFYEFARRYPLEDGTLYQGFVTANANQIFESTNEKREEL